MVGKLIAKGLIRDVAIRKMKAALKGLYIEGLKNNIPLHKVVMDDPTFIEGSYTTNYITEVAPQDKIEKDINYVSIYRKLAAAEARNMGM
jgi:acetyl/propionyl-CoA carboxylase alpha subunit